MDYSDFDLYPPLPRASYPDTIDEPYIADTYETSPDYSLSNYFDCDSYFDRPLTSIELSSSKPPMASTSTTISIPAQVPLSPTTFASAPFGHLQYAPSGFFDPLDNPLDTSVSPQTQHSRTPSLCDSDPYPHQMPVPQSPEASPKLQIKAEPTSPPTSPPSRKRSRPRPSNNHSATSPPHTRTTRISHNQVERKYRENLNASLERLRHAIPTLPQNEEGQPKPSKAMVLEGAIEYIARMERERDMYREECERMRVFVERRNSANGFFTS